jgi:predicted amidohydrolase
MSAVPNSPLWVSPVALNTRWKDHSGNVDLMLNHLERVHSQFHERQQVENSARHIVVFPELSLTGFVTVDPETVAIEEEDSRLQDAVQRLSQVGPGFTLGFPRWDASSPQPRNTTWLVHPSHGMVCSYDKLHLFTQGEQPESRSYSSGTAAVRGTYHDWKVSLLTCFDIRFPEMLAPLVRAQVDLVLLTANWVAGPGKSVQLIALARAAAIWLRAYVVVVNRIGSDQAFSYSGEAAVIDPTGGIYESREPILLDPHTLEVARAMDVESGRRLGYELDDQALL